MKVVGHFENRAALGTVGITPRKVLAVILQKVALIESMKPQWQDLNEERRTAEKSRDSTRGTRRVCEFFNLRDRKRVVE
jgi:hypothetical protein